MSFMEGFAKGFADSFNSMEQRRTAMKQDAFRIAYDSYLRKREQYDADKKADVDTIDAAKAAVEAAGTKVPASAWEHAYKWLKGGMSFDNVIEQLQAAKWSTNMTPSMPETPPTVAQASMQEEMNQSGLSPTSMNVTDTTNFGQPQVQQPVTQPEQPPQPFNPMDAIFGEKGLFNPAAIQQRQFEGANRKVMQTAGLDQATFNQINTGYTPAALPGQAPAIEGYVADSTMDADAFNKLATLYDKLGTRPDELADRRVTVEQLAKSAFEVDQMVSEMEGVLTGVVGGTASGFNTLKNEFLAAIEVAGNLANENPNAKPNDFVVDLEKRINSMGILDELGSKRKLFISKMTRMIYNAGRATGQTDRFSNQDFENLKSALISSNDYPTFSENLRGFVKDQIYGLDRTMEDTRDRALVRIMRKASPEFGPLLDEEFRGFNARGDFDDIITWTESLPSEAKKEMEQLDEDGNELPTAGDTFYDEDDDQNYIYIGNGKWVMISAEEAAEIERDRR